MGGVFSCQGEGTQIRQNQGIHPRILHPFQIFREQIHLAAAGHGVDGHMDLDPARMGKADRLGQLLRGEIPGEGAHPKAGQPQIHRIRAVEHAHFEPLHVSRGAQQFQFLHISLPKRR